MKRILSVISIVLATILFLVGCSAKGKKPFEKIDADSVSKIDLYVIPLANDNNNIVIEDRNTIREICDAIANIVVFEEMEDNEAMEGQWVEYTIHWRDGSKNVVVAYNPKIYVDGIAYRAEYEPCEELNRLANELTK